MTSGHQWTIIIDSSATYTEFNKPFQSDIMFKSKVLKTTNVCLFVLTAQPISTADASGLLYYIGADLYQW